MMIVQSLLADQFGLPYRPFDRIVKIRRGRGITQLPSAR
jgi:hypothetical protein